RSTSRVTGFPVWLVERGPLVALQPLGARRGHAGARGRGRRRGRAPWPRGGPRGVEGDGVSGGARRGRGGGGGADAGRPARRRRGGRVFRCGSAREGRWWRCSRSALVEGTPGLLVEGGGAGERRSRAPCRSTSRVTGFPVWLVERGPLVALQPLGARRGHAGAARGGWWRGRAP